MFGIGAAMVLASCTLNVMTGERWNYGVQPWSAPSMLTALGAILLCGQARPFHSHVVNTIAGSTLSAYLVHGYWPVMYWLQPTLLKAEPGVLDNPWALFGTHFALTTWNMTENYCLPFLAASIWLIIRTINHAQTGQPVRISFWEAFVHGLAFSVCILTRVTNAIPTCIDVLILVILLIMRKQWKILGLCIVGFLAGFLILVAPFAIYFAANGAFYDFLYGTILYNISYGAGGNILREGFQLGTIIPMFFIPVGLIIGGALLFMAKTMRLLPLAAYALFCGLAFTVLFLHSNPYPHYAIPCVPLAPLAVAGLHRFFVKRVVTALLDVIADLTATVFVVQYIRVLVHSSPLRHESDRGTPAHAAVTRQHRLLQCHTGLYHPARIRCNTVLHLHHPA